MYSTWFPFPGYTTLDTLIGLSAPLPAGFTAQSVPRAGPRCTVRRKMSTGAYGHLQADDRAWFIADSLKWLIEHDRGEPMRAQKAYACQSARA